MTKKIDSCQPEITCQTRDLINSIGKKTIRFDSQKKTPVSLGKSTKVRELNYMNEII